MARTWWPSLMRSTTPPSSANCDVCVRLYVFLRGGQTVEGCVCVCVCVCVCSRRGVRGGGRICWHSQLQDAVTNNFKHNMSWF